MVTRINGEEFLKIVYDSHNSLSGLQGGISGSYFHNTSSVNTLLTSGTHGDIIFHDGTSFIRLNANTSGYILETRNSGYDPIWVAPPSSNQNHELLTNVLGSTSGMHYHLTSNDNTLLTSGAQGDIIFHNGTNFARLNASTSGYILETKNSGYDPVWIAPPSSNQNHELLTNIMGSTSGMHYHLTSSDNTLLTSGICGDVIYHDGTNFTRLSPGTSGYLLETRNSGDAPVWVAPPSSNQNHELLTNILGSTSGMHYHLTSNDNTLLTSGIYGDIMYHNGTSFTRLSPSTSGYILETRNSGAAPIWVASVPNPQYHYFTLDAGAGKVNTDMLTPVQYWKTVELSNGIPEIVMTFTNEATQSIYFDTILPRDMVSGSAITITPEWKTTTTDAGGVQFDIYGKRFESSDPRDVNIVTAGSLLTTTTASPSSTHSGDIIIGSEDSFTISGTAPHVTFCIKRHDDTLSGTIEYLTSQCKVMVMKV